MRGLLALILLTTSISLSIANDPKGGYWASPTVYVHPTPFKDPKPLDMPKDFPQDCSVPEATESTQNRVEIRYNDSNDKVAFRHLVGKVCLKESQDIDFLQSIFDQDAPNSTEKKEFIKQYSDGYRNVLILCRVNSANNFCELTLMETDQDALKYDSRNEALSGTLELPIQNTFIDTTTEFDQELVNDALLVKVTHEDKGLSKVRFYLQK